MSMFCYQCEQTVGCKGCTAFGVCGKDPETAAMQDLLIEVTKGLSQWCHKANTLGKQDRELDIFVIEALFSTVTNVNFDAQTLAEMVRRGADLKEKARQLCLDAASAGGEQIEELSGPAALVPAGTYEDLVRQAEQCSIEQRRESLGEDIAGLQDLILYGLKGTAAYVDHAMILGREDPEVYAFFHEAMNFLAQDPSEVDSLLAMSLKVGEVNLKVMELLDAANTGAYGHPEPTSVRITPKAGKCILVSGHDLKDLAGLLEQTRDTGINIYTHGEMLPAHGYPELKKYSHLAGNYGGAWQDQQKEFDSFPGPILMTTNCIQKPREGYKNRIFTCGLVQWPGVKHLGNGDFSQVIEAAKAAPGFTEDEAEKNITVGFGHNAVLGAAEKVIELVKNKSIRHFFLIGGCDGAKSGRNYFTDLASQVPDDCMILTLACGKFRFNKMDFGQIDGLPRLLDVGQCNDAYSAIKIAGALAGAFECDVNDLPLSMVLSWYEQKAVCILLTLLHLGIKDIRLGPSLPAFVTPNVLQVLVDTFDLKPISTPQEDLKAILG
jgi:hydroxylamine reductase